MAGITDMFFGSKNVVVKTGSNEKPYTGARKVQNLKVEWQAITTPVADLVADFIYAKEANDIRRRGKVVATWTMPFNDYDYVQIVWKTSKNNGKTWTTYGQPTKAFSARWFQASKQRAEANAEYSPVIGEYPTVNTLQDSIYVPEGVQYVKCEATPVAVDAYNLLDRVMGYKGPWIGETVTSNTVTVGVASPTSNSSTGSSSDQDRNPSTPTVTIDGYDLTAEVNNYKIAGAQLEFELVENDNKVVKTQLCDIILWRAEMKYKVTMGKKYKARVRAKIGTQYTDWSDYCNNVEPGVPNTPAVPAISFTGATLLAEIDNYNYPGAKIRIELVEDDTRVVQTTGWMTPRLNRVTTTYTASNGHRYKARSQAKLDDVYSDWSDYGSNVEPGTPSVPGMPTITINGTYLLAEVTNYPLANAEIQFEIVEDDETIVYSKWRPLTLSRATATYSPISPTGKYKARARARADGLIGDWTDYCNNVEPGKPPIPTVPTVTIEDFTLVAEINNYSEPTAEIEIEIVCDNIQIVSSKWLDIILGRVALSYTITLGSKYKARARARKDGVYSDWSDYCNNVEPSTPVTPAVPQVTIDGFQLTATVDDYSDSDKSEICIQIIEDDINILKTAWLTPVLNHVSLTTTVTVGKRYKARAMARWGVLYSEWSNFSSNESTIPGGVDQITEIRAVTFEQVYLAWSAATGATGYEIEYATNPSFFDASSATQSESSNVTNTERYITGLESGQEWFFRVRGTNAQGSGEWSETASIVVGTVPSAPTTWSYTTVVASGEDAVLNWVHNSEDESKQTGAEIELDISGTISRVIVTEETSYSLSTTGMNDSTMIYWRVRTKGALNEYGEWSVQRLIKVFAPPTVALSITGGKTESTADDPETITAFPLTLRFSAGPVTQTAISFTFDVISLEEYDIDDYTGKSHHVVAGSSVHSTTIDNPPSNALVIELTPGDILLKSGIHYRLHVNVATNAGLTAENEVDFYVAFESAIINLNTALTVDQDNLSAYITPYAEDSNRNRITEGYTLSVYRRNYDATMTAIATGLSVGEMTTVVDPHPALDYARYRLVAQSNETGLIYYKDLPGYRIGETSIIIQWDEEWTPYLTERDENVLSPIWNGSFLKLPYNIDVSDNYSPSSVLVEYIGREHPVSYYGTQKGVTAQWSCEIKKTDSESLYAIRRLAAYMGDVYIREPSGSGYWANVKVSYNINHSESVIPVTFDISRVEGGM